MQRSGLGKKVAGLLPALLCIGWAVVVSVPHTSPNARTATFVLAVLGAVYWLTTGLMERDQHRAWYKQSRILVGLAYLLALPAFWLFSDASPNVPTFRIISEIALFLIVIVLVVMAGYARRESEPSSVERRRESLFSRKTPPFR